MQTTAFPQRSILPVPHRFLTVCLMMLSLWIPQGLTADADRGQTLTQTCIACHGADGNSIAGSFPSIAGQNERYLLKQLREIKSGARAALLMVGQLDSMSDQDLADMAAYYASQTASGGGCGES